MAFQATQQHDDQDERTQRHVEAVETREQEERRTVDAGIQGNAVVSVSFNVFQRLQCQEQNTQRYCHKHPLDQTLAVFCLQRNVCIVQSHR